MKNRTCYRISLILLQSVLIAYPGYNSDQNKVSPSKSSQSTMFDKMNQALQPLMEEAVQGDEGIGKRVQKRSEARATQQKAKEINKTIKSVTSPLKGIGTTAGIVATASGDYHAKAAAAIFRVAVTAVEGLGSIITKIVIGVARYQERSQEILSVTELLVEDIRKSIDKIKILQQKQKALLEIGKTPEPSQSSSRLKRLGKNLYNAPENIKNKALEATDVFTNEKAERGEKLKGIQTDLKEENKNFSEIIRLLQIKLLQDAVKEIDKKISVVDPEAKMNTISILEKDIQFFKVAKEELNKEPTKKTIFNRKSEEDKQREKQRMEIDKKNERATNDLVYYMKFQKSPTETLEKLKQQKSDLIEEIKKLTRLTKMGDAIYLQGRGIETADSQLDRSTIVALYREIDDIKGQLNDLKKGVSPEAGNKLPKDTKQAEAPPPRKKNP